MSYKLKKYISNLGGCIISQLKKLCRYIDMFNKKENVI